MPNKFSSHQQQPNIIFLFESFIRSPSSPNALRTVIQMDGILFGSQRLESFLIVIG